MRRLILKLSELTSLHGLIKRDFLPLLLREKKICLGVDPFWSRLAMVATQDIALNNFFRRRIVIGGENLPLSGSVVLAPTHRS